MRVVEREWVGVTAIAGVGVLAVGVTVFRLVGRPDVGVVGGLTIGALPVALGLGLVVAGGLLATTDRPHADRRVLVGWCLGSAAGLTLVGGLLVATQRVVGSALATPVSVLTTLGSAGGVLGLGAGIAVLRQRSRTASSTPADDPDAFRALFANLPNPGVHFVFRDDDPEILEVNEAFEKVYGHRKSAVVGRSVNEVVVTEDRRPEAESIDERLRGGEVIREEVRRKTADGFRDFLLTAIPYRRPDGAVAGFSISVDITDRKQHLGRLQVLNRVLRHDLRNEGNIVLGYADLVADRHPEASSEAARISAHMERLVDLGDTARYIDDALARGDHEKRAVDLVAVVTAQLETFREQHPEADIEASLPAAAHVRSSDLLDRVVENALENAVVHNDRAEPYVRVTVSTDGSGFVTLSVVDDGPGIPRTERVAIEGEGETPLAHATGLGLWFIQWVVQDAGGEVTATDREPRGTELRLRFPQVSPEP